MDLDKLNKNGKLSKELTDFILNLPIFGNLDSEELQYVADQMKFIEINPDEILFNEWDRSDYVCFVVYGSLSVMKKSGPDDYAILSTLKRGKSLGEMALIDNSPRSATVKANTKSILALLPKDHFDIILENRPAIGIKLLKGIARLLSHNLRKTSSRLADYLLPLS
ncbi:MAG: cyclic nucleotide-binding domain-containing protein [Deltaproteobacteria bacterium]|nr:cyclic nucleotide-binding domain-containing protein [Deltaproteobacteria bacterium]